MGEQRGPRGAQDWQQDNAVFEEAMVSSALAGFYGKEDFCELTLHISRDCRSRSAEQRLEQLLSLRLASDHASFVQQYLETCTAFSFIAQGSDARSTAVQLKPNVHSP